MTKPIKFQFLKLVPIEICGFEVTDADSNDLICWENIFNFFLFASTLWIKKS